jgi:hypothetical protein
MNSLPMILRLVSGSLTALQRAEEQLGFVGVDQRDVVVVAEHGDDLFRLVLRRRP